MVVEVFNPPFDALIDLLVRNQTWRTEFQAYSKTAQLSYNNFLRFILLFSVVYSGIFLYLWDMVMTITTLSVELIAILLLLEPIWSITSPNSYSTLVTVKASLFQIFDTSFSGIIVVVEVFRSLIRGVLEPQKFPFGSST